MNLVKKAAGMAAAAIIALSMVTASVSFTAFAAAGTETPTYSITIYGDNASHTYSIYQIFAAEEVSGNTLRVITWGANVDGEGLLTALQSATGDLQDLFTDCTNAADVAEVIADFDDDSVQAFAFADIVSEHLTTAAGTVGEGVALEGQDPGYYLVVDSNVPSTDAHSKTILEVVGSNVTITPKSAVPTVEKKVSEESYTQDDGYGTGYNDVADWDIGDNVPFKLIGTMPERLADYDTYQYIFHDTLSNGLSYNNDAKVYVVNDETRTEVTTQFSIQSSGNSLTISCTDVTALTDVTVDANSEIVVEYTAKLDTDAEVGRPGNPNEVYLEFSNNPDGEGTGSTTVDKVIVFTYELDTLKIDGDTDEELAGATFTLQNAAGQYVIIDEETNIVTGWTTELSQASQLVSGEDGLFKVIGLDDGEYTLTETAPPNGYNMLRDPIVVTLTATTYNGQEWDGTDTSGLQNLAVTSKVGSAEAVDGTASPGTGVAEITVENHTGSELPSTGGIGTTIFFAAGGVLVVGSGIALIAKKRMKNREN